MDFIKVLFLRSEKFEFPTGISGFFSRFENSLAYHKMTQHYLLKHILAYQICEHAYGSCFIGHYARSALRHLPYMAMQRSTSQKYNHPFLSPIITHFAKRPEKCLNFTH